MRYGIGAAILIVVLAAACAKPAKAPEGVLFKDDLAFLEAHSKVVVLGGADGQAQVAVNPGHPGPGHDQHGGGPRRVELRLDRPGGPFVRRQQPAHELLRRRGPFLARPRGRAVLRLLQEGRPLRSRPLVDAAGGQRGGLRRRGPGRGPDPSPQGHPPRELLRNGVRSRGRPDGPAARRGRGRGARRAGPGGRQDGRLRLRQPHHQHRRGQPGRGTRACFRSGSWACSIPHPRRRSSSRSGAGRRTSSDRPSTTPTSARSRPTGSSSTRRGASSSSAATASSGARSASPRSGSSHSPGATTPRTAS